MDLIENPKSKIQNRFTARRLDAFRRKSVKDLLKTHKAGLGYRCAEAHPTTREDLEGDIWHEIVDLCQVMISIQRTLRKTSIQLQPFSPQRSGRIKSKSRPVLPQRGCREFLDEFVRPMEFM